MSSMKLIIALSLSVFSSALFALPAVGDMALFKVHAQGYEFTQKQELVSFNAADNTFVQKETTSIFGQESVQNKSVSADSLTSEEQLQAVLDNCTTAQIGGTLEQVTVPAGVFSTCGIATADQAKVNLAVVPFGVVKFASPTVTLELMEYKFGK